MGMAREGWKKGGTGRQSQGVNPTTTIVAGVARGGTPGGADECRSVVHTSGGRVLSSP
jgi:hypothetical protein